MCFQWMHNYVPNVRLSTAVSRPNRFGPELWLCLLLERMNEWINEICVCYVCVSVSPWNSLPASIKLTTDINRFKKLLKAHLFHIAFWHLLAPLDNNIYKPRSTNSHLYVQHVLVWCTSGCLSSFCWVENVTLESVSTSRTPSESQWTFLSSPDLTLTFLSLWVGLHCCLHFWH